MERHGPPRTTCGGGVSLLSPQHSALESCTQKPFSDLECDTLGFFLSGMFLPTRNKYLLNVSAVNLIGEEPWGSGRWGAYSTKSTKACISHSFTHSFLNYTKIGLEPDLKLYVESSVMKYGHIPCPYRIHSLMEEGRS